MDHIEKCLMKNWQGKKTYKKITSRTKRNHRDHTEVTRLDKKNGEWVVYILERLIIEQQTDDWLEMGCRCEGRV